VLSLQLCLQGAQLLTLLLRLLQFLLELPAFSLFVLLHFITFCQDADVFSLKASNIFRVLLFPLTFHADSCLQILDLLILESQLLQRLLMNFLRNTALPTARALG